MTVKGTWNSSLLKKGKFWEDEITKLPGKWQKVVEQNGKYIVQWSSWWKWIMSFGFTLKTEGTFFPTQYIIKI